MVKKICLVTGAAGFIGSHMVDFLLKKKYHVIGIDNLSNGSIKNLSVANKNKKFKFLKKDFSKVKKGEIPKNIHFIFHYAGIGSVVPSIEKPLKYFQNNALKTIQFLEFLRNNRINFKKFVYAASSSCYGLFSKKTNENTKISIQHPYAYSKYVGEQSCLLWAKIYNLPIISIRIFNAYGLRFKTTGAYGSVIGVFLRQKLSNYPLTICGNGNQKRDYVHITDVVNAFYLSAISKQKNQIYNLGYGKPNSVKKLANIISNKFKKIPYRKGEPFATHADISKIKRHLKWKPVVSFEEGMSEIMKNISFWKTAPLWTTTSIKKYTKTWTKLIK